MVLAATCLLLHSGCARDSNLPETAPVSGTVMYKGKPLPLGSITFQPDNGERPAGSMIDKEGRYRLTTYEKHDGAVVGKHKVTIRAYDENIVNLAPSKYETPLETPLTYEVAPEVENEFDIVLED
jgi:hypothetical protein